MKKRRLEDQSNQSKYKLILECNYNIYGKIASLGVVKLKNFETDCILLSFKDAKITILCWDPYKHEPKIYSMHCYERDEFQKCKKILKFFLSFPLIQ